MNNELKQACKAMALASIAAMMFEPATRSWYDNEQRNKDAGEESQQMIAAWKKIKDEIRAEDVRRAVELANQLAEAAFGGES